MRLDVSWTPATKACVLVDAHRVVVGESPILMPDRIQMAIFIQTAFRDLPQFDYDPSPLRTPSDILAARN
jgi:hypothetical protein